MLASLVFVAGWLAVWLAGELQVGSQVLLSFSVGPSSNGCLVAPSDGSPAPSLNGLRVFTCRYGRREENKLRKSVDHFVLQ